MVALDHSGSQSNQEKKGCSGGAANDHLAVDVAAAVRTETAV